MVTDAEQLPIVLYAADVASILRIKEPSARKMLAEQRFGPCRKIGKKWSILKSRLLDWLSESESTNGSQSDPPPQPKKDSKLVAALRKPKHASG